MMKKVMTVIIVLLFSISSISGQSITWTDITTQFILPEGVEIFKGERQSPALKVWYLNVDLNNQAIGIRPYLSVVAEGKEGIVPFVQRVGAIAAINGGFFGNSTSYSAVVYPGEVMAQNISTISRSGVAYPVTRSFFGVTTERVLSIDWIYHFGSRVDDIYIFEVPTANSPGVPAQAPIKADGNLYEQLLVGIGGGPTLVKDSSITITYNEEVFWGSGVGYENTDPRTAVGYTRDNHIILLVADGRQSASEGVSLPELAQIMITLGCVEAMNLDGGGSTQMAIGSQLINRPEGGVSMRAVPTILAVVYADSIKFPKKIYYEKIIDTADNACTLIGYGWFPTANAGFWGTTPSMLNTKGNGERYAQFRLELHNPGNYEIFAWWVADPNRCKDTPFIISHISGFDTIKVDQTQNGSKWNAIGSYDFSGDSSDAVVISDAATMGTYIVADAIRIVSYDSASITLVNNHINKNQNTEYILSRNYPNPFNSSTTIEFFLPQKSHVTIKVYDILGKEINHLFSGEKNQGNHRIIFTANDLSSGVYFYQIKAGDKRQLQKILLLR